MRKLGIAGLLCAALAVAACRPMDTWSSRVEDPGLPPFAPDVLLRQQADFRLYDPHLRKEFFLYLYEDDQVKQEVITVIDHGLPEGERRPRMASIAEHDHAMASFDQDWRLRRQDEKLRYFNEKVTHEDLRNRTLYDHQMTFKAHEIAQLDEQRIALDADLKSRTATGAYAAGDEKFKLVESSVVQRELNAAERRLALARGQYLILEYLRRMRDARYARGTADLVEREYDVRDLLAMYPAADRLAEEIKMKVLPEAWTRQGTALEADNTLLRVVQSREVQVAVSDYLGRLRTDFAAQRRK
jgi:hypothetical protein